MDDKESCDFVVVVKKWREDRLAFGATHKPKPYYPTRFPTRPHHSSSSDDNISVNDLAAVPQWDLLQSYDQRKRRDEK